MAAGRGGADVMFRDVYLGDGVYASYDGYAVTLDLRAQAPTLPITKIMLEPNILARLNEFYTAVTKEAQDAQARTS